jgi:hypothetical protein
MSDPSPFFYCCSKRVANTCFCGCSLKVGTILAGVFMLIHDLMWTVYFFFFAYGLMIDIFYIAVVLFALKAVVPVLVLIGVCNKGVRLIRISYILLAISNVLFAIIFTFLVVLVIVA